MVVRKTYVSRLLFQLLCKVKCNGVCGLKHKREKGDDFPSEYNSLRPTMTLL